MTLDANSMLLTGGVSLIAFLFQFYFKKIAKSLEAIGQIHKDLDELKVSMEKLTEFREEFLMMKNELEGAIRAINSIKDIEHKISLMKQSQDTQWTRYDSLKIAMKRVTVRSRDREHFFLNKLHVVRGIIEEMINTHPEYKLKLSQEFLKEKWDMPVEMHGKMDEFE